MLGKFDIDLDLPNHRMSLYERGHVHAGMGRSRAEIRIGRSAVNGHMFFPVRLDSRKITATIDTGAQRTTLSVATAHAMGSRMRYWRGDRPVETRGFGGGQLASRIHRFASLTVGNIRLSNPEIVVTELRAARHRPDTGNGFPAVPAPLALLRGLSDVSFGRNPAVRLPSDPLKDSPVDRSTPDAAEQ